MTTLYRLLLDLGAIIDVLLRRQHIRIEGDPRSVAEVESALRETREQIDALLPTVDEETDTT